MMAPDDAGTGVGDNDHVRILRYQSGSHDWFGLAGDTVSRSSITIDARRLSRRALSVRADWANPWRHRTLIQTNAVCYEQRAYAL
jgi:hypothetical protein